MSRKKKDEHWAFDELRKSLSEKPEVIFPNLDDYSEGESRIRGRITKNSSYEADTILLFNPSLKATIHNNFKKLLYPKILGVFENSQFQIIKTDDVRLKENINSEAFCSAYFYINDSERLGGISEDKWWNIGFELKIMEEKYLLDPRLTIYFPYWLDFDWIFDFIIDARKWSTKPSLSSEHNNIILSFADGSRRHLYLYDETDLKLTLEIISKNISIAKAIDRFSANPTNRFLKSHMLQVIKEVYEDY